MPRLNPIDRLSVAIGDKLCVAFLIIVAITSYEVVMRYGFNSATIWVNQSTIALSALAFIFAGTYTLQRREHIAITSIYQAMPGRVKRVLDLLCSGLTVVYLALLLIGALMLAIPSVAMMERSGQAWDVPIPAFLKGALAVGVTVMLAQALVQLVACIRRRDGARK